MIRVAKEDLVDWVARELGDEKGRAVIFRELSRLQEGGVNRTVLYYLSVSFCLRFALCSASYSRYWLLLVDGYMRCFRRMGVERGFYIAL